MEMEFKQESKPFQLAEIFVLPRCIAAVPEPYKCRKKRCTLKTDFKVILSYHKRVVHKKSKVNYDLVRILEKFYCDKCQFETCSMLLFLKHRTDKHTDESDQRSKTQWYKCGECKYQTGMKSDMDAHTSARHTYSETKQWFTCAECDFKSKYKNSLQVHLAFMNHEEGEDASRFDCDQCAVSTRTERGLRKHALLKHPIVARAAWFTCHKCPFKARNRRSVGTHVFRKHTAIDEVKYTTIDRVKWFKCEQCPFKSRCQGAIKTHTVKHDDNAHWFKCAECSFRTKWKHSLTTHMRGRHRSRDGRSFECEHCWFATRWKSHLAKHMLIHK